jgi:SAM-dependent methyltransferase
MSYKVYLFGSLNAIEWSQAVWKVLGDAATNDDCALELLHDVMLRYLPKDGLIVDAGCGTGRWPIHLQGLGYRTIGIELSHEANLLGKRQQPDVRLVEADVNYVPFKEHAVDAVLSLGVVEHNEAGPLDALRETHRILKPNGLLILSVPYNNLFRRLIVNHLMRFRTWQRQRTHGDVRFAEYRYTKREMRAFLRRCGFEVLATHPNDYRPPKNVGLWVDYNSAVFNPYKSHSLELFVLPGRKGAIAQWMMRRFPWLVCGEVAFVARAR